MFDGLVKKTGKAAAVPKGFTRAEHNGVLRVAMGKQFASARELNGFGQSEAAALLGYRNSTQLSLIEMGKRLPPHEVILRASTVYGVSTDFLLAISDEPERDPKAAEKNALLRHFHSLLEQTASKQVTMLMQYLAHGIPSIKTSESLLRVAEGLVDDVRKTHQLNQSLFDNKLKNGAKLLDAAEKMAQACTDAREMLTRHERLMEFKMRRDELRKGVTHPLFDAKSEDAAPEAGRFM